MKCDRDISISDKQGSSCQPITQGVKSGNFWELLSYVAKQVLHSFWVLSYMESYFQGHVWILNIKSPLWLRTCRGSSFESRKEVDGIPFSSITSREKARVVCQHSLPWETEKKQTNKTDGVVMLGKRVSAPPICSHQSISRIQYQV